MISRTSIFVAAGRAVGAREPDPSVRNPDYLAEKLLGDASTLDVDHPAVRALSLSYDEAMKDVEVVNNVRMMTIRTRFIDDALERAIAGGATQVVILGAGFDSHAYRCQTLLERVTVFEVDRPPTQVIVTTHSPYLLDLFRDHPEEVIVTQKRGREAHFERLSDRPDLPQLLEEGALGDLWFSGIIGGVPEERT